MNQEERDWLEWLKRAQGGVVTQRQAAEKMGVSDRWVRKLLVRRSEARKLAVAVQREGMTLVPLKVYFNLRGIAKIELGIAKGKKLHDKRQTEKARDWARDKARLLRSRG